MCLFVEFDVSVFICGLFEEKNSIGLLYYSEKIFICFGVMRGNFKSYFFVWIL